MGRRALIFPADELLCNWKRAVSDTSLHIKSSRQSVYHAKIRVVLQRQDLKGETTSPFTTCAIGLLVTYASRPPCFVIAASCKHFKHKAGQMEDSHKSQFNIFESLNISSLHILGNNRHCQYKVQFSNSRLYKTWTVLWLNLKWLRLETKRLLTVNSLAMSAAYEKSALHRDYSMDFTSRYRGPKSTG